MLPPGDALRSDPTASDLMETIDALHWLGVEPWGLEDMDAYIKQVRNEWGWS